MNLADHGHAVSVLAYGALAITLLRRGAVSRERRSTDVGLLTAVILSALWAGVGWVATLADSVAAARLSALLDLARYGAWYAFLMLVLRSAHGARTRALSTIAAFVLSTIAVVGGLTFATSVGGPAPGLVARNLPLVFLALPVAGAVLVEQVLRRARPDARWHLKPLGLGLAGLFVYDLYLHSHVLLLGRFDIDALAVRPIAHALPVALLYVAVERSAGWAGSFELSRSTVFHTATLMLVGAYLLLLAALGYYVRNLGGDWGGALVVLVTSVGLIALATLALSGALRARLRVFVGKNFFRYRYDYRTEWLRFTGRLTSATSPHQVGELVARALAEMMHSPAAALWYRDSDGGAYVQASRWNAPRSPHCEPVGSAFAHFIGSHEWVVDLDDERLAKSAGPETAVPPWLLERHDHWLVVPLIAVDSLSGFVVIERSHAPVQVNWEVRDLLKTAGRQAASYLALMHATDALLEARKFDAFNKMSAFVVHDLKNIVAQLSLMMQNARRLRGNPEFQEDMLATVDNALAKMQQLMNQLRRGAAAPQAGAGVALAKVLERLSAAACVRGRSVELDIAERVACRGAEDRVERVLGHLMDNALDATSGGGTVALRLSRHGSQAEVTVRDSGIGMSREFVETRLFRPFASTKATGMGIGSYETHQYIREIGGSVSVDSEPGRGTVVTVRLPVLEIGQPAVADLYDSPP